jgi:hypothetical protein
MTFMGDLLFGFFDVFIAAFDVPGWMIGKLTQVSR